MELLWLLLGLALLILTFVDALWTTLWLDGGGGPLTSRLTTHFWQAVLRIVGRRRHHGLSLFGPVVIVLVMVTWVLLLWAGWALIYASDPGSLVSTGPVRAPADWPGRIWFVAYAMSTMGNGDFVPVGGSWQLIGSLTTLSGFFLASLVISYLLSLLGAVVAKRAFAAQVTGLGESPSALLTNSWSAGSFRTLDLPLSSLSSELALLTEQYLSFPVLQYYHAARAEKSPAVAIARLDEALTLLSCGVPADARPAAPILIGARAGVHSFLKTLDSAFIPAAEDEPPAPDLGALRAAGVPTVDDEEFARGVHALADRRKKLLGLLRNDGWTWETVQP